MLKNKNGRTDSIQPNHNQITLWKVYCWNQTLKSRQRSNH